MTTFNFIAAMAVLALIFAIVVWKAKKEEKENLKKYEQSLDFLATEIRLSNGKVVTDVELLKLNHDSLLSMGKADLKQIINYTGHKMVVAEKNLDNSSYDAWSNLFHLASSVYYGYSAN